MDGILQAGKLGNKLRVVFLKRFCMFMTVCKTLKPVCRRKLLTFKPVWAWGCVVRESSGNGAARTDPVTAKLYKGCSVCGKYCEHHYRPFRADQYAGFWNQNRLETGLSIQEGRADDETGEAGQFVGTQVSPHTLSVLSVCTWWADFRPPEGLEGAGRRQQLA